MYSGGTGIKQRNFKAVEYWQKACDLNNINGCNILGFAYENGKNVKQSRSQSLKYYGKSCDLKSQLGCKKYAELNQ
jgi:TPR repeat protein